MTRPPGRAARRTLRPPQPMLRSTLRGGGGGVPCAAASPQRQGAGSASSHSARSKGVEAAADLAALLAAAAAWPGSKRLSCLCKRVGRGGTPPLGQKGMASRAVERSGSTTSASWRLGGEVREGGESGTRGEQVSPAPPPPAQRQGAQRMPAHTDAPHPPHHSPCAAHLWRRQRLVQRRQQPPPLVIPLLAPQRGAKGVQAQVPALACSE